MAHCVCAGSPTHTTFLATVSLFFEELTGSELRLCFFALQRVALQVLNVGLGASSKKQLDAVCQCVGVRAPHVRQIQGSTFVFALIV